MNELEQQGRWLCGGEWFEGRCVHAKQIRSLDPCALEQSGPLFLPAPVDLHVHGGGGHDVMDGDKALRAVLACHAKHGTGALLATSVTAPVEDIDRFLSSVERVMAAPDRGSASLLGAHLEGPFINPDKLGAQPDYPQALDVAKLEQWCASGVVRVITYAPELDVDNVVPDICRHFDVRAQLGHTLCSWAKAQQALMSGVGVTHLFNAMSAVSHRRGGAALAALAYAEFAEIITDGVHVDQAAFDAARRAIKGLYSVTDATAAAGMPDGQYRLGSLDITKQGEQVLLTDGTLAGSCLTQQKSITVLRQWGLDWPAISRLNSTVPAQWLGTGDLGDIKTGGRADWLEVGEEQAVALWLEGQRFELDAINE